MLIEPLNENKYSPTLEESVKRIDKPRFIGLNTNNVESIWEPSPFTS